MLKNLQRRGAAGIEYVLLIFVAGLAAIFGSLSISALVSDPNDGVFAVADMQVLEARAETGSEDALNELFQRIYDETIEGTYVMYASSHEYQGNFPYPSWALDMVLEPDEDHPFAGVRYTRVYCFDVFTPMASQVGNLGDLTSASAVDARPYLDQTSISYANGLPATENLDLAYWVVAQDFEGAGYGGWDVQFAIWALIDIWPFDDEHWRSFYDVDIVNVQNIIDEALALPGANDVGVDSFVPQMSDRILVLDPGERTPENTQPIVAVLSL